MVYKNSKRLFSIFFVALLAFTLFLRLATPTRAADHAESTSVGGDPNADIADVFAFLDPNDNSKVILAIDVAGFIVPSELLNLSFFPPETTYQFQIENTGDARPDMFINITFSAQTSRSSPQTATVRFSNGITFTAPTTVQTQSPAANPFVVTTEPRRKISFYAGLTDDPFFFDIVGFNRFTASAMAGAPDVTRLQRARDSFSGYNIHMIALSVPASLLRGNSDVIGVNGVTLKNQNPSISPMDGTITGTGPLVQIDRMATPVVNTVFIPFPRKNEYNSATPQDDANGRFAADIITTAQRLGVTQTNIDIFANLAVVRGDYLRLNLTTPNSSLGDGEDVTAPGFAGFPNGRRPGDDTIDTALFFVTNQATPRIGDGVPANDRRFLSTFPFFAPPHQPLENPQVDNTQN